jgi:hypothetical protein
MEGTAGKQNWELWAVGGIAIIAVFFLMSQNSGSSSGGLSFVAPDPTSVAAVESANTSMAQSADATALASKQAAVGLAESVISGKTTVATTNSNNESADYIANVGATASQNIVATQAAAATAANQSNNDNALAVAKVNQATTEVGYGDQLALGVNANAAAVQETTIAGQTAQAQSNNQTTQAQAAAGAQKTSSIFGAIGQVISSIIPFSKPSPNNNTPAPNTNTTTDVATANSGNPFGLVGGFGEL